MTPRGNMDIAAPQILTVSPFGVHLYDLLDEGRMVFEINIEIDWHHGSDRVTVGVGQPLDPCVEVFDGQCVWGPSPVEEYIDLPTRDDVTVVRGMKPRPAPCDHR